MSPNTKQVKKKKKQIQYKWVLQLYVAQAMLSLSKLLPVSVWRKEGYMVQIRNS